jgi:hypothetical protein
MEARTALDEARIAVSREVAALALAQATELAKLSV